MLIQPYQLEELSFAWSNRICFALQTHRRTKNEALAQLTHETLDQLLQPYQIHLLELATDVSQLRLFASLQPSEPAATSASKIKGRISKWLNQQKEQTQQEKKLARGYFAVTVGKSTSDEVQGYLDKQCEHHGYSNRARPPVLVKIFAQTSEIANQLSAVHAVTSLRFHLCFATQWRRGIFTDDAAKSLTEHWRQSQLAWKTHIDKVSFLPDHVHLAVSIHPSSSPAKVVLQLMDTAQKFIWEHFEHLVVQAKVTRLWQASAYIGSFGDLSSNAISAYVKQWETRTQ